MFVNFSASAQSQKYAYVDTQYILDNIPEFQDAQDELDEISTKWQKEIETNYAKVSEMYQKYQAESVLLPDDIKRKREEDIVNKETGEVISESGTAITEKRLHEWKKVGILLERVNTSICMPFWSVITFS